MIKKSILIEDLIPGGSHTYSKGKDQFSSNVPSVFLSGYGAYLFDEMNNRILDYGMGLRSVILGYADKNVNEAAKIAIDLGNNLTRPSKVEYEAAKLMVELIDSAEMVKFAKNGSNVTTAAIKLARAYTGKDKIAVCRQHPFFSFDDWFIVSTPIKKGIPTKYEEDILLFNYNDVESLNKLFYEYPGQIAAVIMEPFTNQVPYNGYFKDVQNLCKKNNALFILDEMITGFRFHLKGAQYLLDIQPDLSTFGKAMANGFSIAALVGKREIMNLGGISNEGEERVFLLSATHGAEMSALSAFIETVNQMLITNHSKHIQNYGLKLIRLMNDSAKQHGVEDYFYAGGFPVSPVYYFKRNKEISMELKTLFVQEMYRNGILIPWIAISTSHGDKELDITKQALDKTFNVISKAINEDNIHGYINGDIIKPVFRKYN
jgi:glutamate-1-semialdehyde 2,1-aminomutase